MARPRSQYRLYKHRYKDKKTGKVKESLRWNIFFKDHLQIERNLVGCPDKSTAEYIAKNVVAIVSYKFSNQPLPSEQRTFIESQPKKLREQLTKWGILDTNTNAGFEPLVIGKEEEIKNSKMKKFNVSGGHLYHWQKSMQANERSSHYISESIAKVVRITQGCKFITPSDINGETFNNWLSDLRNKGNSINNSNAYLNSFKSFVCWMLKTGRMSQNPIRHLNPLKKTEKEHQRIRRPLNTGEINKLITATVDSSKHHGLTGYERNLVYRIALQRNLYFKA